MASTTILKAEHDRKRLILSIKLATLVVCAALVESLFRKAGFRPDQSRVPAGVPEGGQWVDEDGDADLILIGGDPNEFPDIPEEPPPNTRDRNSIAVRVAMFLLATNDAVRADAIRRWVWEHARDRIIAYLDGPKFLDELQRVASEPKPGYEIHHIVEQTPARQGWIFERADRSMAESGAHPDLPALADHGMVRA